MSTTQQSPIPVPTDALADHLTVVAHDGAIHLAVRNAEVRLTVAEAKALAGVLRKLSAPKKETP